MAPWTEDDPAALLAAALLLTAVAWLRGAEYDEQYTLFLTGVVARPAWPAGVITAGEVRDLQSAHAGLGRHRARPAQDGRASAAVFLGGGGMAPAGRRFAVRGTHGVGAVQRRDAEPRGGDRAVGGIPVVPAVLLTVGCYGFAYTGAIARGFALAQMLSVAGIAVLLGAERRASRMLAAGALLGAATFANYLAVFTACAVLLHMLLLSLRVHTGRGRPALDETSLVTVMAGLVPAIRSGRVPRPMAGTSSGHDGESDAKSEPGFLLGAKRRGNLHRGAQRDGDCFAPLAMTVGASWPVSLSGYQQTCGSSLLSGKAAPANSHHSKRSRQLRVSRVMQRRHCSVDCRCTSLALSAPPSLRHCAVPDRPDRTDRPALAPHRHP